MIQVTKEAGYQAGKYAKLDRFASYAYQVQTLLSTSPSTILEIGVGDGVVSSYFARHSDISYKTVDFAADLSPDIVADVRALPFENNAFDTVCAFQVLEHLPFEDFESSVGELMRVAKKYVIISLPHFSHPLKFSLKIPLFPEIKVCIRIPHPKKHVFDGQHYWEIGKRGYSANRIRSMLQKIGTIEREITPFENPAHHFFVLKKMKV
ncbi:MAG TPA: methyltransferase domain-containing protein [Candidatus Paceibacterota bacterium]